MTAKKKEKKFADLFAHLKADFSIKNFRNSNTLIITEVKPA